MLMTLSEAEKLGRPIVYGLCKESDGVVVYVGRTARPAKRFYNYRVASACHNPTLRGWLERVGDSVRIVVLADDPASLNESEREWIGKLRGGLFNLVAGGEQAWRQHSSMPWMAGTGIVCPSAILLQHLKRNSKAALVSGQEQEIINARASMNLRDRCLFELGLCRDVLLAQSRFREAGERWLSIAGEKLLAAIEGSQCVKTEPVYAEAGG